MTDQISAAVGSVMRVTALRYFECVNTDDWDGMRAIWREDGELRAVGARPRLGRDEVIGYFMELFDPWPRHEDRASRLVIAEEEQVVLAEVAFSGRTADGRDVSFDAVDVFQMASGKIAKLTSWYDISYVRRALAAPGAEQQSL